MRTFLFIMMFFIISGLVIVNNHNLMMYKHDNLNTFKTIYVSWLGSVFSNAKTITGDVVAVRWLPSNSSIS